MPSDSTQETSGAEAVALSGLDFLSIGHPVLRKEDRRLLTGEGRFSDDFNIDGQAYAVMVRSPHPHAAIRGIDKSAALAMPGVLGVFDGRDCADDGLSPIPHSPVPSTRYDMKLTGSGGSTVFEGPHPLLPADKARHVGEAVAMVVAESRTQALDAAEAVLVDFEELPWVASSKDALAPDAPAVWDEVPGNATVDTTFGDRGATDAAFAEADHVVRMDFDIARVTAVTTEPRAALANFDAESGRYTLWAGSGGAVRQKSELSRVLGIDPDRLRVLSFDVGGNFGSRNRVYVEFGLVLWASGKVGRPVKYTATRSEAFLTDYQGRDLVTKVEAAFGKDGRILAMRADNISNIGAHCVSLSPLGKGSALITGSYHVPTAYLRSRAVFTNTMPTQAYRSSGRPEVIFAIERVLDTAAAELGLDRIAIRRMNLVGADAFPYTNAIGTTYDSGTYEANMDLAMKLADWDGVSARRADAQARGRALGLGLANYVESSTGAPRERAAITVTGDGAVDVVIGTQPSGQGHETSFAQVAADLLHVPVETVNIIMGDTDVVSLGGGSHSGRSMRHAGTVISMAAGEMIDKGRRIAAHVFDLPVEQVAFTGGTFTAEGTNRALDVFELAREAAALPLPDDLADGLSVVTDNEMHKPVFPNGCAVCEVELDPDTGRVEITRYTAVDDVGRCVNPLIVHGQTHGGIAQGVGQAMWEQCYIDPETGQPLTGSLMDYAMPKSDNLPHLKTEIVEVLSPTNPLGIKAGGEGGTTPALAVVIGAIVDALKEYGVRDITMPATPVNVWRLIQEAKADRQKGAV